jgi:coenzyme F420-0:L-glutamate ligase / coenzyme F420-1:gamma-L-glutamate ligase
MAPSLTLTAVPGIPLVKSGDDLAAMIAERLRAASFAPIAGDIIVVAQKIVSKAEGRIVALRDVTPSPRACEIADIVCKDPRLVELILSESTEVVRAHPNVLIVAHRLGFVMANAGIDQSNIAHEPEGECALLLPIDPDKSCAEMKRQLDAEFGVDLGIVINDSFGRAWRHGVVGVALGCAGLPALWDRVGAPDLFGRTMRMTQIAVADEIASAASLLMGQTDEGLPVVLMRGFERRAAPLPVAALLRPRNEDLFR